jgi:hypothetical protein
VPLRQELFERTPPRGLFLAPFRSSRKIPLRPADQLCFADQGSRPESLDGTWVPPTIYPVTPP